jgi:hypothetical protein
MQQKYKYSSGIRTLYYDYEVIFSLSIQIKKTLLVNVQFLLN